MNNAQVCHTFRLDDAVKLLGVHAEIFELAVFPCPNTNFYTFGGLEHVGNIFFYLSFPGFPYCGNPVH